MYSPFATGKNTRRGFVNLLLVSHMKIAMIGVCAMLLSLLVIFYQAKSLDILSGRLIPLSQASTSVLAGVQESLANLRGWVSLDDERFVENWQQVWDKDINPAAAKMNQIGSEMQLPGFSKRISEVNLLLEELKTSQWWVVEVAQTPGNEPAKVKYIFEVEPVEETIHTIIQMIFELSAGQSGRGIIRSIDDKKIHEIGTLFYKIEKMLEEIVFLGEVDLADQFRSSLYTLQVIIDELQISQVKNSKFEIALNHLQIEVLALKRVAAQVITIRNSYSWNVVRHQMETETVPLAKRVIKITRQLDQDMNSLLVHQADTLSKTGKVATIGLSILLVLMVTTAAMISKSRAAALSRPVTLLADAANRLAAGTLAEDIPLAGDNELTDLTNSFNVMRRDLVQTQKKIVTNEKLAAIGRLSGSVAHDIRNPLGIISNSIYFLNLIIDAETDKKIKEHINIMDREIIRANDIITDLMDFSRDNVPVLADADLNLLIERCIVEVKIADTIYVEKKLLATLPIFPFDSSQISRVILNLLNNAIQAQPNGGRILVYTGQLGGNIELTISDDGVGIPPENIDSVFEPLFTTKSKGVGLGLSIVKTFVEKHKGFVALESIVGKGSQFTITLPVGIEESA